ncbi:MAG: PilN domain-containing protein [Syntrophobacteraceae bacterium]|jgi:general secretion pathway protein L
MLKGIIKYRPSHLYAVYIEPHRIEMLQANRRWRKWEIGPAEQFNVPSGESVFDHLQHLNLKPRGRKGSALLAIVSSVFYSVHREHYPLSIKDHLDEAINFDWQENIFYENDATLHFFGTPVALQHQISVPIFSIQTEIYDKLNQAVNGPLFHTFAVVPSGLSFAAFLHGAKEGGEQTEMLARSLDEDTLEVHRFYRGAFLDSTVAGKSSQALQLFCENLKCLGDETCEPHIHLVCAPEECRALKNPVASWEQHGFPIKVQEISGSFVENWLHRLLKKDAIHTFDAEILLKPWDVPRIAFPLAALVLIFALYGFYQAHSAENMAQASKRLKVQISQLETQWKPIEELQTRITKFREDQKTLSEFNHEDYRLMELMSFLTRLTPEDTWLNYLSLRKGQLILRGESKSALKYLAELSKIEGLTDVKFASPVTRDPGTDQERFNVQLQLDIDKLKKGFEGLPTETSGPAVGPGPEAQAPDEVKSGEEAEEEPEQVEEQPDEAADDAAQQEDSNDDGENASGENSQ